MTIDVEDYFHVSAFAKNIDPKDWDNYACRVEQNTHRILDMFDAHNVKATFFVLGWVAERYPALVKEIGGRKHEVACHGYSHQLVYRQTQSVFRDETVRAKRILEDLIGEPVLGYRAASYSITQESLWALDVLVEAGFSYDSSIFPVRHDRYGIPDAPRLPHRLTAPRGGSLVEFPLSTKTLLGYVLPVSGGGYFRLYPYGFTKYALNSINKKGEPFVFYLHPWELDPQQPRVETSALSKFRHYNNLDRCEARLESLLKDFRFSTMKDVLSKSGLLIY